MLPRKTLREMDTGTCNSHPQVPAFGIGLDLALVNEQGSGVKPLQG
jgi:hypothetical protein